MGAFSFTGKLWDGLGPALVVAVAGLVLALRRRSRTDLILAAFVLAYLVDLLTIRAHFDRYVLPLVPALAALAGRQRAARSGDARACPVVPLVWAIGDDVRLTRDRHARSSRTLDRAERPADATDGRRVLDCRRSRAIRSSGSRSRARSRPFDPDRNVARLRGEGVRTSSSPARSPTACSPRATNTRGRPPSTGSCEPGQNGSTMWSRATD